MPFIAGAYTATFNAIDIGRTERGFNVEQDFHHETIIADSFGEMLVDGVQQGVDTAIDFDFIEYDLIAPALFGQSGGAGLGNAKVGLLLSSLAKQLILTPIAGTSAATSGKIWTFPLTIVGGRATRILLSSKNRKGPLRFMAIPNLSTGITYTTT